MSGTRDRLQAQAPRPFMPKLANATPTTFPRSPPKPRLAAQTPPSSVTAALQSRRPLTAVINTPPLSRQSPTSGRSSPVKSVAVSQVTPRSGSRLVNAPPTQKTTTNTMSRSSTNTSLTSTAVVRPRLARGVTTASMPALHDRPGLSSRKSNGSFLTERPIRVASPSNPQPPAVNGRSYIQPAAQKTGSFFHADEVPIRSPSPEIPSVTGKMNFLYASSTKLDDFPSNSHNSDQPIISPIPTPRLPDEQLYTSSNLVSYTADNPVSTINFPQSASQDISSSFIQADNVPKKDGTVMNKEIKSQDTVAEVYSTTSTTSQSRRPSASGQRRQSGLDISQPRPIQSKTRTTSVTRASSNSVQGIATPPNGPIRVGTQSNRSSINALNMSSPVLAAPTIAESQEIPQPTEHANTAASARHERKLLDLEISNSSLLAINRTLEREVAKQKAELKRLRRATLNRRSWTSDVTDTSSEAGSRLSDDEDDDSFIDEHDIDSNGQTQLGNSRRQSRRKLHLDLSKHREMLIDSQKMNVAIQQCLRITDQLIKDGDKALEYQVDLKDVIAHDAHDDDTDEEISRQALQTRYSNLDNQGQKLSAAESFFETWGALSTRTSSFNPELDAEPTDRDSGIDVGYVSAGPGTL